MGCSSWGHRESDMTAHTHTHTHTDSTQESPGLSNVKAQECFQLLYNFTHPYLRLAVIIWLFQKNCSI